MTIGDALKLEVGKVFVILTNFINEDAKLLTRYRGHPSTAHLVSTSS